jgi:hypothetical protein
MEKYRRFGMWNVRSLCVRITYYNSRGLARYNLDLVWVKEVTLDKMGTERVRDYIFFL